jgi:hypothetical protein
MSQYSDNYVPSPEEIKNAKDRLRTTANITFWIDVKGWRLIQLLQPKIMPNVHKPELVVIYYKPDIVIQTPYMATIDGNIAVSKLSLDKGVVTWMNSGRDVNVGFRPANPQSEDWLRLKLALAGGMKFRSHGFVDKDKIIYTQTP